MAEQKLSDLLANLVQGKREKDARLEALLEAIKIPSNINKLLKINSNKPFNVTQDEEIINMKAINSNKPFKVTHDIKSFLKIFDEEIIDLRAAYFKLETIN